MYPVVPCGRQAKHKQPDFLANRLPADNVIVRFTLRMPGAVRIEILQQPLVLRAVAARRKVGVEELDLPRLQVVDTCSTAGTTSIKR